MDMVHNVLFCLLMLLSVTVHLSVTEEYETCNVHERLNTGLAKILDPARVIAVSYDTHSSFDCYRLCCNSTVGGQCNAVTFYKIESDDLCMMLDCTPFGNCVWMTADGFYAAHVTLSTVSSQINSPPDTSETEVTTSPLTEELTTISSTPSPQVPVEAAAAVETVTIPSTESQPYSSSIVKELSQNDDEWKWNTEGSVDNMNIGQTDRNTQTEPATTLKQDFPEQQGFPTQGDFSINNHLDDLSKNDQANSSFSSEQTVDSNDKGQADDLSKNEKRVEIILSGIEDGMESWNFDALPMPSGTYSTKDNVLTTNTISNNNGQSDDRAIQVDGEQNDLEPWNFYFPPTPETGDFNKNEDVDDFNFADGSLQTATPTKDSFTMYSYIGVDPEESEWSQSFNEGVDPADSSFGDPKPSNQEGLPEGDSVTGNSETTSEEDNSTSDVKHREMRRMLFQTPAVIIGLCSALGVSFLVLVAVCRKVYINHDRPRYKQLRDYDIRFEPPAASSALLP